MTRRSIDAAGFRRLILDALPELGPVLATPVSAHADAAAAGRFGGEALAAGDEGRVVRVLRLVRRLADLGEQLDYYCENALWTSLTPALRGHEREALAVLRQLSPAARKTLYCPASIPHTWFGRDEVGAECAGRDVYTARGTGEKRARCVRQTGGPGRFGDVTLRVSPGDGPEQVAFVNGLAEAEAVPLDVVEWVRDTVRDELARVREEGTCLRGVEVTLVACVYHPIDTRPSDVSRVTAEALREALAEARVVPAGRL
jgi:hypothetical protein